MSNPNLAPRQQEGQQESAAEWQEQPMQQQQAVALGEKTMGLVALTKKELNARWKENVEKTHVYWDEYDHNVGSPGVYHGEPMISRTK